LDGKHSALKVGQCLSAHWNRKVSEREVEWIINEKLAPAGIIEGYTGQPQKSNASRPTRGALALQLKVDLLSKKHLHPLTGVGQLFFACPAIVLLLPLSLIVHVLAYLQIQASMPSFTLSVLSAKNSFTILLLSALGALFHELGHLSACHRYGAEYGKLGVGIYFLSPVFYVDVTDAWRLPRRQRVMVDVGGVYFQLIFSAILYGIYLLTGESVLLFSVVATVAMFISNLNPMFKFDGYWALSDAIGVPNLHKRVGDLQKQVLPMLGRRQSSMFLQTRGYAKIVLGVYALATTLYFAYCIWLLVWLAPAAVRDYPGLLVHALTQAWQNLVAGEILAALSSIFEILFPTILLVGLLFLGKRFVLALYQIGKKGGSIVHSWWQNRRSARQAL
jgi:putative peptide zinc metalloprotease protein